jgi:hypothetical protein
MRQSGRVLRAFRQTACLQQANLALESRENDCWRPFQRDREKERERERERSVNEQEAPFFADLQAKHGEKWSRRNDVSGRQGRK